MTEKVFEFTYMIVGKGSTYDDALADALDAFQQDFGEPIQTVILEGDQRLEKNKRKRKYVDIWLPNEREECQNPNPSVLDALAVWEGGAR